MGGSHDGGERIARHAPRCRDPRAPRRVGRQPAGDVEHGVAVDRLRHQRQAERRGDEPGRDPHTIDRQPMDEALIEGARPIDATQPLDDAATADDER